MSIRSRRLDNHANHRRVRMSLSNIEKFNCLDNLCVFVAMMSQFFSLSLSPSVFVFAIVVVRKDRKEHMRNVWLTWNQERERNQILQHFFLRYKQRVASHRFTSFQRYLFQIEKKRSAWWINSLHIVYFLLITLVRTIERFSSDSTDMLIYFLLIFF